MKKSLWIILLLLIVSVFAFSACDSESNSQLSEKNHVHSFGEWKTIKDATCTLEGEQERICSCGEKETQSIDALGHTGVVDVAVAATCTTDGKTEGKHCSVCNETLIAQNNIPASHTDGNWVTDTDATCTADGSKHQVCSVCNASIKTEAIAATGHTEGEWVIDTNATCTENGRKHQVCSVCTATIKNEVIPATGTEGLLFYYENGAYIVDRYTQNETNIVIPQQYNDGIHGYANVIGITKYAFSTSNIVSISFPDSVQFIDEGAFKDCAVLSIVKLNEGIKTIGAESFRNCNGLLNVDIPKSVTSIGDRAFQDCSLTTLNIKTNNAKMGAWVFYSCNNLTTVTIAEGTKELFHGQFEGCNKIIQITLPKTIEIIGYDTFMGCDSLRNINIPKSVKKIKDWAFYRCSDELIISYEGTSAEWRSIVIATNNEVLYKCKITYQSN